MRMLSPISMEVAWPRRALSTAGITDVFENLDGIVDAFLRPTNANSVKFLPSCYVKETKEHYIISFDMPGV